MKWTTYTSAAIAAALLSTAAFAQNQSDKTAKTGKEGKTEEIVIRKKPGKAGKTTIVIDGDNVTVNGKSINEFKDDDMTVWRRNMPLAMAAPPIRRFNDLRAPFDAENHNFFRSNTNKAMLGVMTEKAENGVKVIDITKESGAEKAGLKKEDVITKVDTTTIADPADLIKAISSHKPNDKVDITFRREGKENKTTAVLGENKRAFAYNFNDNFNFNMPDVNVPNMENFDFNFNRPKIGLQIQDVEEGKGVKVRDVDNDSPASKAGMKEGDVITQVNGKDVAGVDELRNTIRDLKEGDTVKFTYKRDGKNQTAEIKIPKRLKSADL